jgi:hypothetical protein
MTFVVVPSKDAIQRFGKKGFEPEARALWTIVWDWTNDWGKSPSQKPRPPKKLAQMETTR